MYLELSKSPQRYDSFKLHLLLEYLTNVLHVLCQLDAIPGYHRWDIVPLPALILDGDPDKIVIDVLSVKFIDEIIL